MRNIFFGLSLIFVIILIGCPKKGQQPVPDNPIQICKIMYTAPVIVPSKEFLVTEIQILLMLGDCGADNLLCVISKCDGTYIYKTIDDIPANSIMDSCQHSIIEYTDQF